MDDGWSFFKKHLWQSRQSPNFPLFPYGRGWLTKLMVYVFIGWNNHIPQKGPDLSLTSRDQLSSQEVLSSIFVILVKFEVRFTIFWCKGYCTPLKIKMSLKMGHFKREKVLQPSFIRGFVGFRGSIWVSKTTDTKCLWLPQKTKKSLVAAPIAGIRRILPCHDVMETPDPPNDNAKALQSQKSPGHLLRCWGLAIFLPFRTPEK